MNTMHEPHAEPLCISSLSARQCLVLYSTLGFTAIITQTVLIREFLVVFYGNELCLGVMFGGWLWWIAVGAGLGARRVGRCRRPELAVAWWLVLAAAAPFVQILAIRLVRVWLWVPAGQYLPITKMLVAAFVVLCPFSLVVGYTFPLGLRLWPGGAAGAATKIGRIYLVEALGSLVGGVLFTFVLVHALSSMACAFVDALLLLGMTAVLLRRSAGAPVAKGLLALAALGALLVGVGSLRLNQRTTVARWQSVGVQEEQSRRTGSLLRRVALTGRMVRKALNGELVASASAVGTFVRAADSPYQNIVLSEANGQYNVFFNGQYSFCFPDVSTYSLTAIPVLVQHPAPRNVLLIDGGNLEMAEAMLRDCVKQLDYVQLDPQVLQTLQPELKSRAFRDKHVRLLHTDGRRHVRTTDRRYDLIFVHLGDPSTAATNRYYTLEFFREVRRKLRPGGVLAFTLSSNETYFGDTLGNYSATIFHTLKRVFPSVLIDSGDTATFFGSTRDGVLTGDQEELVARARGWLKPGEFPPPEILYSLFFPERSQFAYEQISKRQPDRLNTDLLPAAYLDYLLLWDRQVESRFHVLFSWLRGVPRGLLMLALVMIPLLWTGLLTLCQRPARRAVPTYLLAVSTTGFSAMGLEVVLLLAFQTALGYLYQWIGLVVATFMLGLAAGAYWVTGRLDRWPDKRPTLMAVHGALMGFAIVVPAVLPVLSSVALAPLGPVIPLTFIVLMVVAGFFTGAQLPLAAAQCLATGVEPTRAAGLVDRADHFGGFVGALLCGAVLLPVIGIPATCLTLAALNLVVVGLLWAWGRAAALA